MIQRSTPSSAKRRERGEGGYTLLETLAAVFIVALVSGVAVASLPLPVDERERDVRAFAAKLERASDEAVGSGLFLGVEIDADGYRFYRRVAGDWTAAGDHAGFGPRQWPEDAIVSIVIEGARPDTSRLSGLADAAAGVPVVRFDPAGVATTATVDVAYRDRTFVVRLGADGQVELEARDAG